MGKASGRVVELGQVTMGLGGDEVENLLTLVAELERIGHRSPSVFRASHEGLRACPAGFAAPGSGLRVAGLVHSALLLGGLIGS
jgi:hypothetical protein